MIQLKSLAGAVSSFLKLVLGSPSEEWSEDVDCLLNAVIGAKVDSLTVWHVKIEGDVFDPYDNPIDFRNILLCCYFNLGIDA